MADQGWSWLRAGVVVTVVLAAAVGCGSGSGDADPGGASGDSPEWVAAELGSVPEGYFRSRVDAYPSGGRRVSYGQSPEDDDWYIQVTAMVPSAQYDLDRIREWVTSSQIKPEIADDTDLDVEVRGHDAVIGPMWDDGRKYGYEVMWEEAPGLMVIVEDSRHDERGEQISTKQSVLELAESVVGMDRAAWDAAVVDYDTRNPYAGPPEGAVATVVATGERDGQPWQLDFLAAPAGSSSSYNTCLRLTYAGEATGPSCAMGRVFLGGHAFLIGANGVMDTPPEVRPGPGSEFESFPVELYTVDDAGAGRALRVYLGILPDGACAIELAEPGRAEPVGDPSYDYLLPGDPGALECAGR